MTGNSEFGRLLTCDAESIEQTCMRKKRIGQFFEKGALALQIA